MTQSDERTIVSSVRALMVTLGNEMPMAEKGNATPGNGNQASRFDHRHPRLTSPHTGLLSANGQALLMFSRQFAVMPAMAFGWVEMANNPPVMFKVVSWLKPNATNTGLIAWTDGAPFAGCIIMGYRGRPLPQLGVVSGVLTAITTGVNSLVSALTGYNPFDGSAAGVTYMATAIQVGDEPAT